MFLALLVVATVPFQEQTVFRCGMRNRTTLVMRNGPNLIYRSLQRGRIELQIPGGTYAQEGFSGGGELQAIFRNGPWTYVVYERTVRTDFNGANSPSFEAGVDVLRNGRVVSRQRCNQTGTQFSAQLAGVHREALIEH